MAWGTQSWGTTQWGASDPDVRRFRFRIYRMLLQGMRTMDETKTGILKRICDGFDEAWEDFIYDPCSTLPAVVQVGNIDPRWLPNLAPLLGFTGDLKFDPSSEELRRLLKLALPYWNEKPSELGVVDYAIMMVTGNRFRIANYFDFRMQIDHTVITEEMEDFDPSVIDFPSTILTGTGLKIISAIGFQITDLPTDVLQGGVFATIDQFKWLVITKDANDIYTLDYDSQTSTFSPLSVLTGATSGAQAAIIGIEDVATTGTLTLRLIGDTPFIDGEVIADDGIGSADADGTLTPVSNVTHMQYDGQTANFTLGATLTGATTGTTAKILQDSDFGSYGALTLRTLSGPGFKIDEAITDSVTGVAVVLEPKASNQRVFRINQLLQGTNIGVIDEAFPAQHTASGLSWRLTGYQDEFITEVRLVDSGIGTLDYDQLSSAFAVSETVVGLSSGAQGVITADASLGTSGTLSLRSINGRFVQDEDLQGGITGVAVAKRKLDGVINRDLLGFLIGEIRPSGERVDVVYVNFIDEFHVDLDQWDISVPAAVSIDTAISAAQFTAVTYMLSNDPTAQYWGDQIVAWKIEPDSATSTIDLIFMATDQSNYYFVKVDYLAKTIRLYERTAAANTPLAAAVSAPYLKLGVQDGVRVDALAEGVGTRIRVKLNGETVIDLLDSPASHTAGNVGVYSAVSSSRLKLVEVNVLPTTTQRIGLNP